MRTGELLKAIPKASGGDRKSANFKKPTGGQFEKSKSEVIKSLGFDRHQAERMQTLADNQQVVKQAIQEARDMGGGARYD